MIGHNAVPGGALGVEVLIQQMRTYGKWFVIVSTPAASTAKIDRASAQVRIHIASVWFYCVVPLKGGGARKVCLQA